MSEERIRIEGSADDLERLRRNLIDEIGDGVDIQPVSADRPGELGEPVLAGLVITLTSAVAIKTLGSIVERAMTHRERMEMLRIYREKGDREIAVTDLRSQDPL